MTDDNVVTLVLVGASLAGPAMVAMDVAMRPKSDDPDAKPGPGVFFVIGLLVTLFAWPLLAGWYWLSTQHWGML